ncbi:hypothetical protein BKA56DRAFT_573644 [Ilyonectria sp. MPI-CAGE-AT-0026]|nr:hypothetical protein BKA56DRAFT_573644 [Ilyonectria sp. MPI-CAGE-AT-0026]
MIRSSPAVRYPDLFFLSLVVASFQFCSFGGGAWCQGHLSLLNQIKGRLCGTRTRAWANLYIRLCVVQSLSMLALKGITCIVSVHAGVPNRLLN